MRICIVAALDPAHQASLLWKAFNEFTSHQARLVTMKESYLGYPTDIVYDRAEPFEIIEVLANTDFFVFVSQVTLFPFYNLQGKLNRTNHLIMTYGSEIRMNSANFLLSWLRNDTMIVTSHDYSQSSPVGFSCQHLPISVDFTEIGERTPPGDGVVRVVHTPTAPVLKQTDLFLKSMDKIREKHKDLKIETVLIEGKSWTECLRLKAQCDLCYDQMAIGSYGMGTVESWAMRQPVIGRANAWLRSWYPDLPLIDAGPDVLEQRLEDCIVNESFREETGRMGRVFAEQNHDVRRNIRKLEFLIRHVQER